MAPEEGYTNHSDNGAEDNADIDRHNMSNPQTEDDWVAIARDAYQTSTSYLDNNIRKQIEKNLALFRSKHPSGSKYYSDSYKYRSKVFRPKVRSMIRRHEAAAAVAFFGTLDVVNCMPENPADENSVLGAKISKNWLTYRLEHSIPWFTTLIGAYQDAMTSGVVISRQEWLYETEDFDVDEHVFGDDKLAMIDEMGQPLLETITKTRSKVDRPDVAIVPLENFRFAAGSDWRDPIGTSPYLIELIPMFAIDIKQRMKTADEKTGEAKWFNLSDGQIQSAMKTGDYDSTRSAREGKRTDSKDESHQLSLYDIVWVHRNIVKIDNEDIIFYTLGSEELLSEPIVLTEIFKQGRPYKMGSCLLETHRIYPSGLPELSQDLVTETNDLANQRLDNIKLILNKRYKARRNASVDWKALTTSVPGGVILMDDLDDVKEESFSDVTGSAYQEQDRINVDFDELVGSFSTGSVQTNRSLNETVGGMSMALDDANIITEYQLRVFTETWVEPVLNQLMDMGKVYETDERVLQLIGEDGVTPEQTSELMDTNYSVKVAVGFGATSPHKRVERLVTGIQTIGEVLPGAIQTIDQDEVMKEIFGSLGYRDGTRFIVKPKDGQEEDPRVQQLTQTVQQLEQQIATDQIRYDTQLKIAQLKEQGNIQRQQLKGQADIQQQQIAIAAEREITNLDVKIKYIKEQIAAEKNDIARGELILQQEALEFKKKDRELELLTNENDRVSSVLMNDRYNMVPAAEG